MNRIKELRQKNNLSQQELALKIGSSNQAISAYEKGTRIPKEKMWQSLANFFNVSIAYIKGAYSKKEILNLLSNSYKDAVTHGIPQEISMEDIFNNINYVIAFNVDSILIGLGYFAIYEQKDLEIFGNIDNNSSKNIYFWQKYFSFIFDSLAIRWLITRPVKVTKYEILKALNESLSFKLYQLSLDDKEIYVKRENIWLKSPKEYLKERQEYIDNHTNEKGIIKL